MPKVGDKFIIEIGEVLLPETDQPAFVEDKDLLYRIKGFKSLVFDEQGLKRLEKPLFGGVADYEKALKEIHKQGWDAGYSEGFDTSYKLYNYQAGLDAASSAIKELLRRDENQEYNQEFFGLTAKEILASYPIDTIVAWIKPHIQKEKLRVGDEVDIDGRKVIVTRIPPEDPQRISYISSEGRTYTNNSRSSFTMTGRHFPELSVIFEQMEADHADY